LSGVCEEWGSLGELAGFPQNEEEIGREPQTGGIVWGSKLESAKDERSRRIEVTSIESAATCCCEMPRRTP